MILLKRLLARVASSDNSNQVKELLKSSRAYKLSAIFLRYVHFNGNFISNDDIELRTLKMLCLLWGTYSFNFLNSKAQLVLCHGKVQNILPIKDNIHGLNTDVRRRSTSD
jgi:hypothetical protein